MIFDISINITRPVISTHIGQRSKYINSTHPGTGNKIQGWKWNEFVWPNYSELSEFSYVPTLFDLDLNIPEHYYQSGFGAEDDIKLKEIRLTEENFLKKWVPIINTGYYYIHNNKWYLFSDQHITEYLSLTNSYHTLSYTPKDTKPIFIGNYKRDSVNSRLKINHELKFNIILDGETIQDPGVDEFITTHDSANGYRIKANPAATANEVESFNILSTTETIELSIFPINDSLVSVLENVVDVSSHWTLEDKDLGILTRNDSDTDGLDNKTITITYTPKLFVKYEPGFSSEEASGPKANINPLHVGTNSGFVQVTTEVLDPFDIDLSTDLDLLDDLDSSPLELKYELNLGNNVGKMTAIVKNKSETPLEGVKVYFDWEGQLPEGYGASNSGDDPSSFSDGIGQAYMYYKSPNTISNLGEYVHVDAITYVSADNESTFDVSSITPTDENDVFLYQVRHDDEYYGLDTTARAVYYDVDDPDSYFANEEITDGTATQAHEEGYRFATNQALNYPDVRPESIDTTKSAGSKAGQKRMVFVSSSDSSYVDPNTGDRANVSNVLWVPLKPATPTPSGTNYTLVYDGNLKTESNVYQYFIVSSRKVKLKAWAYNESGQKVFSNEIEITIKLPNAINGLYYASALNAIPDELLHTIPTFPVASLDLLDPIIYEGSDDTFDTPPPPVLGDVTIDSADTSSAYIPLGFRIKSAGITVAALLDQVTFLTKE